jgi:hypothetical protein
VIALVLLAQVAAAAPAPAAPPVRLERILDGRGRVVATSASTTRSDEGSQISVRLIRGLGADDLVQREVVAKDASGMVTSRALEVWLADRAALRLTSLLDGRIEAGEGADAFRFFEADRATRTVRCNLLGIVEALDARLVPAAAEYARLKEELGDPAWSDAELPLALLRELRPPRPPATATHRRSPMPEEDPARESLAAAALAAVARPIAR